MLCVCSCFSDACYNDVELGCLVSFCLHFSQELVIDRLDWVSVWASGRRTEAAAAAAALAKADKDELNEGCRSAAEGGSAAIPQMLVQRGQVRTGLSGGGGPYGLRAERGGQNTSRLNKVWRGREGTHGWRCKPPRGKHSWRTKDGGAWRANRRRRRKM